MRSAWTLPRRSHAGRFQTASKGEVRAIVEAAERATAGVHIVTDSKYAMDKALDIKAGAEVPEGTHKALWERFKLHAHKVLTITKIKSHLTWEQAGRRGVPYRDWIGHKRADILAGIGADMHGYTKSDEANKHTDLVTMVQKHLVETCIRMLENPSVMQDRNE